MVVVTRKTTLARVILLSLRETIRSSGVLPWAFCWNYSPVFWFLQAEIIRTVEAHIESRIPPFLRKADHFGQGMSPLLPLRRNGSYVKADSKFGINPCEAQNWPNLQSNNHLKPAERGSCRVGSMPWTKQATSQSRFNCSLGGTITKQALYFLPSYQILV